MRWFQSLLRAYEAKLNIHDSYLLLSDSARLVRIVHTSKSRLYDFPRNKRFLKDREVGSTGEHEQLIGLAESGVSQGRQTALLMCTGLIRFRIGSSNNNTEAMGERESGGKSLNREHARLYEMLGHPSTTLEMSEWR